jgi:hypothetical protein
LLDILSERAQERCDGETGNANDEELLAAEAIEASRSARS